MIRYVKENKEKINARFRGEYAKLRRLKFPEKVKARETLQNAVKSGKIIKGKCIKCGSSKKVHGHHTDYKKPLVVVWLCPFHHKQLHK